MKLIPIIASYSGSSYRAVRAFLDEEALRVVATVAASPRPRAELDLCICDELVEMHAFAERDGMVRLDTSVFLEADIEAINATASEVAAAVAGPVAEAAAGMRGEPPTLTNFLVGIIGIGQALGHAMWESGAAVDWRRYGGRYAQSKVDFNEDCPAYAAAGPDLQNKTVLRGARYTAVFIGPGGRSYCLEPAQVGGENGDGYLWPLNTFLTDAFASLLAGQLDDAALRSAAEWAGLLRDGVAEACVVTGEIVAKHRPVIESVRRITHACIAERLGTVRELLAATTGGRQGVPPENMVMNLWRYLRRAIARELYARGLFTDRVPETGLVTVFYENRIAALEELLG